jgi:hypothetical protein
MRGSNYDVDARLCDGLADAVYTVWMAQRQQQRLAAANNAMQYEVKSLQAQGAWQSKAVKAGERQGNCIHAVCPAAGSKWEQSASTIFRGTGGRCKRWGD